ncbi:MSMEG_0570 family nitrogen starvation response protein [Paraconexibacter algicola]|uniref:MSMEG_0570 family nitrogen starvation response protein n=1 Tax=Paraconexibacter algicola TaxID=2133960 RepID=A0A2T4UG33_9ACTN|nr:MSMEG_0570 family nitrogen starvation response protein [Paraconexibacter algicola]PTL58206.1 MSMEG_0570 family nitrogen starvation response protein [Paraconexibacter algicola]
MPTVDFTLRWPDGRQQRCTSPSTVIHEHFVDGQEMPVPELVARMRVAMHAASERVRARYGFACTGAAEQLEQIESVAARYGGDAGPVTVVAVGKPAVPEVPRAS